MRVRKNPTFDIETGKLLSHDGEYEYSGPAEFCKGGTSQAQGQLNTDNALANTLSTEGQAEQAQILPFLQSEMTNPQGFGEQGTNELLTAGGQATSGALGNATEQANLRASRTGNPSSSASIIDAASRAAGQQQSNNALGVDQANLQEKLNQQQAGEQGIASLASGNIGQSLSALGLSNQAVNEYITAANNTNPFTQIGKLFGGSGGGAVGGLLSDVGNVANAAQTGISNL